MNPCQKSHNFNTQNPKKLLKTNMLQLVTGSHNKSSNEITQILKFQAKSPEALQIKRPGLFSSGPKKWYPWSESNWQRCFRRALLYPFNYRGTSYYIILFRNMYHITFAVAFQVTKYPLPDIGRGFPLVHIISCKYLCRCFSHCHKYRQQSCKQVKYQYYGKDYKRKRD